MTDSGDRVRAVLSGRARIDSTTIDRLGLVTEHYRKLDGALGPRKVLDAVNGHLHLLENLTTLGGSSEARARLLSALGAVRQLKGWLLFDLGRYSEARLVWQRARAAADEAGNPALVAYILGSNMGYMESFLGNSQRAVDLAYAADGWARRANSRKTEAYVATILGQTQAQLRDERSALITFDRARSLAEKPSPHQESPWLHFFGPPAVDQHHSAALINLGYGDRAVKSFHNLVDGVSEDDVRNRAFAQMYLAQAYLSIDEIDTSVAHALDALVTSRPLESRRLGSLLSRYEGELRKYKQMESVKQFRDARRVHV